MLTQLWPAGRGTDGTAAVTDAVAESMPHARSGSGDREPPGAGQIPAAMIIPAPFSASYCQI